MRFGGSERKSGGKAGRLASAVGARARGDEHSLVTDVEGVGETKTQFKSVATQFKRPCLSQLEGGKEHQVFTC